MQELTRRSSFIEEPNKLDLLCRTALGDFLNYCSHKDEALIPILRKSREDIYLIAQRVWQPYLHLWDDTQRFETIDEFERRNVIQKEFFRQALLFLMHPPISKSNAI